MPAQTPETRLFQDIQNIVLSYLHAEWDGMTEEWLRATAKRAATHAVASIEWTRKEEGKNV